MRYRDIAAIACVAMLTVWMGLDGKATVESMLYDSRAINRDDARSVLSTLLPPDEWVDFHILSDATTVRLLTNAALRSMDAPDHDLTNPREGYRYTLEYELLDAQRNVVDASVYHFRTQVRQLKDVKTGEPIYPIFLGKSGLVSAQTRPMHLAIDHFPQRPVILRVRLTSADAEIQEVVGRSLSRIERADFDKRFTWNRLSQSRRELICKYTVYQPDLLTFAERTNLLKWRWAQTPAITESPRRHLYFIGGFDDLEIRDEQLPAGLYTDQNWLTTVPVPEGRGQVRLEFNTLDPVSDTTPEIDIRWFGIGLKDRLVHKHALVDSLTNFSLNVDGGLIELQSPVRLVTRVYWSPLEMTSGQMDIETEITPTPFLMKAFVVDDQPLEYSISHLANSPTPTRLQLRYPFGSNFANLKIESTDDPRVQAIGNVTAIWEFWDRNGKMLDAGELSFSPVVSLYDNLELVTGTEWLSEPQEYFFSLPRDVAHLRIRSPACRLLANVAVRPPGQSRVTQVPEDYHAFHRRMSTNRTWFGLNPTNEDQLVQANRSFILRSNARPPENDEEILAGNYQWRRFQPNGQWIGRQMLVPQASEIKVRDQAVASIYFELNAATTYDFAAFNSSSVALPAKLIVIGEDAPGNVTVTINDQVVHSQQIRSARGELDLADVAVAADGTLSVSSDAPARFFFAGRDVPAAECFLKRTAQRLGNNTLTFGYEKKSSDDELLTIQMYRRSSDDDRCQLRVVIDPPEDNDSSSDPLESWTVLDRTYDLRPHHDQGSLLIGHNSAVDVGHRCFVRLGKELAPGTYQIRVQRMDDGADGYVLMYQTLPGQSPQPRVRVNPIQRRKNAS